MITALLLTSLTLAPAEPVLAPTSAPVAEPTIKVWLNKRADLRRGDRGRVYVRPDVDGYLLVLHVEPDGRIRVLFPLDPYDDNYVRGARDYEIEGRGGREAFRVYQSDGAGTVFAAFSRDPFQFDAFVQDDHWDYRLLEQWRLTPDLDPETELTALTQQLTSGTYYDYDLTSYFVGQQVATTNYYSYPRSYGISIGFGNWYPWSWRMWAYSSSWACSDPFWWGSYRCDPYYGGYASYWYDPWYYRPYRYAGWYGYYPQAYGYYAGSTRYVYAQPNRLVLRRYTFKPNSQRPDVGGITVRRRFVGSTGGTRTVQTASNVPSLRRPAPSDVFAPTRRVSSGPQTATTPRSGTQATGSSAPARRAAPGAAVPERRQVQPDGWGITDGRRTVTPTHRGTTPSTAVPRREQSAPTAQPQAPVRRPSEAQPTRRPESGATPARPTQATPTRRPSGGGTVAVPSRRPTQPQTQRSPTPQRSSTPQRQTAPSRSTTPSRATPSRTPSRASPRRPSTPTRTAPSRPATPSRATPSRPTPSRAPAPRTAPARPSAPRATPAPRRPSGGGGGTPARSSGSSRRRPGGGGN
jgi:Domain of unknown function (DUF4384)